MEEKLFDELFHLIGYFLSTSSSICQTAKSIVIIVVEMKEPQKTKREKKKKKKKTERTNERRKGSGGRKNDVSWIWTPLPVPVVPRFL